MKETEFNLLDEGWILARKDDCTVDALSLTDAILRSHEYSGLSGELPTQDVSVLRLMLAVLHTVFLHEFGFAFFGIHVHTSELIHLEHLSVLSDTGLLEEDWPR